MRIHTGIINISNVLRCIAFLLRKERILLTRKQRKCVDMFSIQTLVCQYINGCTDVEHDRFNVNFWESYLDVLAFERV